MRRPADPGRALTARLLLLLRDVAALRAPAVVRVTPRGDAVVGAAARHTALAVAPLLGATAVRMLLLGHENPVNLERSEGYSAGPAAGSVDAARQVHDRRPHAAAEAERQQRNEHRRA